MQCRNLRRDMILRCLDDKDESIKLRALDLISGMVSIFDHKSINADYELMRS